MQVLQKFSTASCLCGNREDAVSPREILAKYYYKEDLGTGRSAHLISQNPS